ncbi:hypothetical protein SAMN04488102_1173 [Alkalibacterium subtropicum]|uniref:YdbS-like PH domain-containing protein n=1 Tax=Alkalibacterium subtropicum TaxID=753702 RepID=A0A1I1L0L3_9LACT|nr:PH domain-containing protein [Alkalibacterium subtropicum]SFC66531.1 hypothetical protein SAMN04488102_1173 [Alkalibacterium subtropicum]
MNYPLLENKLPESVKKVWKKSSLLTFLLFVLSGAIAYGIFTYFSMMNSSLQFAATLYFSITLILFALNFFLISYRYNYFRYEISTKEIIFQKGFIFRSITYVPFSRIQHIETEQGPFLRQEGLMELIIHTAATNHHIAGLSIEEAQMIRQKLVVKVEESMEDGE